MQRFFLPFFSFFYFLFAFFSLLYTHHTTWTPQCGNVPNAYTRSFLNKQNGTLNLLSLVLSHVPLLFLQISFHLLRSFSPSTLHTSFIHGALLLEFESRNIYSLWGLRIKGKVPLLLLLLFLLILLLLLLLLLYFFFLLM